MYDAFCSENTNPNFLRNDVEVILDIFEFSADGKPVTKET
jgi:hypothetical protein